MAGQYDDTNRGVLFKNDRKESPNHPDYKGSINVGGEDYWISGWIKTAGPSARNPGSKFLSVQVTPKEDKAPPPRYTTPDLSDDDDDDDIPF